MTTQRAPPDSDNGSAGCKRFRMKRKKRDARPVVVFEGAYQDAAFLASLLVGSGIEAVLDTPIDHEFARSPRVLVDAGDLDDALPLVRDFEQNGTKVKD